MEDAIPAQQEVKQFAFMIVRRIGQQGEEEFALEITPREDLKIIPRVDNEENEESKEKGADQYSFAKFADSIVTKSRCQKIEIHGAGIFSWADGMDGTDVVIHLKQYAGLFRQPQRELFETLFEKYLRHKTGKKVIVMPKEVEYKIDHTSLEKYTVIAIEKVIVAQWSKPRAYREPRLPSITRESSKGADHEGKSMR